MTRMEICKGTHDVSKWKSRENLMIQSEDLGTEVLGTETKNFSSIPKAYMIGNENI